MSEGFEPYHVPQQSRRDKLRIVVQTTSSNDTDQGCVGLMPLYDPTLLPSDLLTCAAAAGHHPLGAADEPCKSQSSVCVSSVVKEEGGSFMGCVGGVGFLPASSSSSSHFYLDPHSSGTVNPSCGQEISNNPFLYATQVPQNLRDFDEQAFHDGVVTFRPQPLSLDSTTTGKGLSLSLSSQFQHHHHPLELNLQHYSGSIFSEKGMDGGYVAGPSSTVNELSRSSVPLGPFTGYASVLKGSRFLKPAQQLLDEFCNVGRGIYGDRSCEESSSMMDHCMENFSEPSAMVEDSLNSGDHGEHLRKKTRLISMLDEVYRRYKQYYQQLQAVITSFESVAGLSTAAPYTSLALKSMSKHFRSLKNAITNQIRFTSNALGEESFEKEETPRFGHADPSLHLQRAAHSSGILEPQHGWRPQRGLPERAVAVLRAWLFEHFLHPYPTDTDKQMLAKQTGLSRNQVSNWFINARVRLWKPMVEEIHTLEMRQAQKVPEGEDGSLNKQSEQLPTTVRLASNNNSQTAATQKNQDPPSKRCRNEFAHAPNKGDGLMNFSCDSLSNPHLVGVGVSVANGGNGGVSLTLGLRQNNGICLSEPLPMNVSSRFGLEENNDTYVMGGFEAYNSHFGKDIGGKLLHDFVG